MTINNFTSHGFHHHQPENYFNGAIANTYPSLPSSQLFFGPHFFRRFLAMGQPQIQAMNRLSLFNLTVKEKDLIKSSPLLLLHQTILSLRRKVFDHLSWRVLKRSQKEASILVQKSCSRKEIDIHNLGNPNKSSKLESDLTSQWRSLFLNMEDIFVHESNQLSF
ncbi:hypothetical protein J1N35_041381 [Gossypium stocksii]|uniref:Uncharacterized protein n=1 Tax=Gossypium stocksii TaxID=47602 RepID=A0A9D3UH89_9ROSI|nr:hypothetical protein J1N35_041381 [Gossypium stocksii]